MVIGINLPVPKYISSSIRAFILIFNVIPKLLFPNNMIYLLIT
jgi:hypothetical protein